MPHAGYHREVMVGETPNIDRIANDGALFMAYCAEQRRAAFFIGMHPLRAGMFVSGDITPLQFNGLLADL